MRNDPGERARIARRRSLDPEQDTASGIPARPLSERVLPWLLVLPALVFATPLSPLVDDPYPHLAGAGFAAVLLAPLAAFVLARGASARRAWPFVASFLWALLAWRAASATDGLEARRALSVLAVLPLAFAGGAALDARGRATFASLLVALSCSWTGWALLRGFAGDSFAGVLGDTGSLSQAALPGAAIASAWLARAQGVKRVAGALALLAFLLHVAAAPVLAGSHTLLAALVLASWRGTGGRGTLLGLALAALLAPFAGMAVRQMASGDPPALEGAPAAASHSLGGLGVRAMVWTAALGMVAEHPLVGAGPGQFQAAFPPYRNPREIEVSRHGVCERLDTEVEHAHNDWLQGFCELGLVGGGLLALGLACAARDGLRALRDPERFALAMAALAMLVNAFVHAPLSSNPAAAPIALALFGTLAGAGASDRRGAVLCCLPALAILPFAPALIRHGSALTDYVRSARRIFEVATLPAEPIARADAAVRAALAAARDSAPARALAARSTSEEQRVAAWDALLAVRPHSVEAWEQSGTDCARLGRFEEARARYARALALSPTHPRILENLARVELTRGDAERGFAALALSSAQGCLRPVWVTAIGNELVLELGLPDRGARVLFGAPLEGLSPEELHERARRPEEQAHAEAAECLAQLRWAREHADAGNFDLALRNYRQAAQRSHAQRGTAAGPAPLFTLEMAAAESHVLGSEGARARVQGIEPARPAWDALPPWAREALRGLGVAGPE